MLSDRAAKEAWISSTIQTWGDCGHLLYMGSDVVAYALFGPGDAFPQTSHFLNGPVSGEAAFLSCLFVREDLRRHGVAKALLQSIEKALYLRDVKAIEAFARTTDDEETTALGPVDFYLKNGFYVKRGHIKYPLVRLDLKTAVPWQLNLEAMLENLVVPLRQRSPAPSR
ncbi:MAG: N-acetyltransferase [Actinobacteria bacterium]|nr:MAG: N-acetyltransferase [Actinomycetota bacterium]